MKYLIILLALAFLVTGCYNEKTPEFECQVDSDCVRGGCSSQLCVSKNTEPVFTTCEYRDEYGCFAEAPCICIEGQCGHNQTEDLNNCLEEVGYNDG